MQKGGIIASLSRAAGRVAGATADLARSTFSTVNGKPSLERLVKGPGILTTGAWNRLADAQWLGPYTPGYITHRVRKLMRRDAQIRLGLGALKSPFFGIEIRVEGGDPRARAFLERVLINSPLKDNLIWSCLNALDFGYQSHELVWDIGDVQIDLDGPGGQDPEIIQGAYYLKKIKDIDPMRVAPAVDVFGELAGVEVDFGTGTVFPAEGPTGTFIPVGDKLLHVVHGLEFDNPLGQSVLDPAYQFWHFANVQYLLLNRYLEQRGNPPLIGYAPNEKRYDEDQPRDSQTPRHALDVLNEQMIALRSGGACALPFEVDDRGNLKWKIDVMSDGGRTETFLTAINHYEGLKLRAMWVPERSVTQDTATGSFASIKEHVDVFFGMLQVISKRTVLAYFNQVAEKLVRANFGRATSMPLVTASELSRQKHALLADLVAKTIAFPRQHEDGTFFNGYEYIDLPRALDSLNAPRVLSRHVPHRASPVLAAAPKPPPSPDAAPQQPQPAAQLARGEPTRTTHETHLHLPQQPAPILNLTNEATRPDPGAAQALLGNAAALEKIAESIKSQKTAESIDGLARAVAKQKPATIIVEPNIENRIELPAQPAPIVEVKLEPKIEVNVPKRDPVKKEIKLTDGFGTIQGSITPVES